jgi:hypothetical protein
MGGLTSMFETHIVAGSELERSFIVIKGPINGHLFGFSIMNKSSMVV